MHHLENWETDPQTLLGDDSEPDVFVPLAPGIHFGVGEIDGVSVLRLHNVVIDLTGAIRG